MASSNNDMVIRSDNEHPTRRRRRRQTDTDSIIHLIGTDGEVKSRTSRPTVKVPPTVLNPNDLVIGKDLKKLRPKLKKQIIARWREYKKPEDLVAAIAQLYPNLGTLSVEISLIKKKLKGEGAEKDWLSGLKLTDEQYAEIATKSKEHRDKESIDMPVIQDGDLLIKQSLEMILSDDFRTLWPAVVCLSGFRPMDILHTRVSMKPQQTHKRPAFWVCVSNISKKPGEMKNKCYDKPLLCPSWLFCRALKIIRNHFCKEPLTKKQYHDRYNKYWLQLLRKGYSNILVKVNHVLLRRAYASMAYIWFKDDPIFPGEVNEVTFISKALSHGDSMEPALRYSNMKVLRVGKFDLFGVGTKLQPGTTKDLETASVSSRGSKRKASRKANSSVKLIRKKK
jgi:hypothetical protein